MAIYLFSQLLKFTYYRIKLIEKLSRRHLMNSFDVFFIKGFTVVATIFPCTVYSVKIITVKFCESFRNCYSLVDLENVSESKYL